MVRVTVRAGPGLAVAMIDTVPGPLPDRGETVTHVALAVAVQLHAACVETPTVACPPFAPSESSEDVILY